MDQNPDSHPIRRIVLPSGRSIEIVLLEETTEPAPRSLNICPDCESDLVQPVEWSEATRHRWQLALRCPNCNWLTDGVFEQAQVDELEERLDEGLSEMLRDLRRLTQANMAEEIDRFTAALQTDLVLPEDF